METDLNHLTRRTILMMDIDAKICLLGKVPYLVHYLSLGDPDLIVG